MVTQPHAEKSGIPQHDAASQELSLPGEALESAVDPLATLEAIADSESLAEIDDEQRNDGDALAAAAESEEPETSVSAESELPVAEASDEPIEPESLDAVVAAEPEISTSEKTESTEGSEAGESAIKVLTALDAADEPALSAPEFVTEDEFAHVVDEALESFGGILLFKMRIDEDGQEKHVAAASIGEGARRQFLLLSLPIKGGKLKVESAARSNSPLAKLAEAYVGVVEAFCAAA